MANVLQSPLRLVNSIERLRLAAPNLGVPGVRVLPGVHLVPIPRFAVSRKDVRSWRHVGPKRALGDNVLDLFIVPRTLGAKHGWAFGEVGVNRVIAETRGVSSYPYWLDLPVAKQWGTTFTEPAMENFRQSYSNCERRKFGTCR